MRWEDGRGGGLGGGVRDLPDVARRHHPGAERVMVWSSHIFVVICRLSRVMYILLNHRNSNRRIY
jgi:phosphoribosylformimino-5-aminoimidazole carboxamide ribonucleotide (ProFAR) isomerase